LTSGIANGALELPKAQMKRYRTRITAIFATLQAVDRQCDAADAADLVTIAGSLNAS
jgi:NADH:ubiquinone oxidoreductase subunit D